MTDIRSLPMKPGVYAALRPAAIGRRRHGRSPFREFLLVCPAAEIGRRTHSGSGAVSLKRPTATSHPSALSLDPPSNDKPAGGVIANDAGLKAVTFSVPTAPTAIDLIRIDPRWRRASDVKVASPSYSRSDLHSRAAGTGTITNTNTTPALPMDVTNRGALSHYRQRLGGDRVGLPRERRYRAPATASRAEAQTTADAVARWDGASIWWDLSKPDDYRRAVAETADQRPPDISQSPRSTPKSPAIDRHRDWDRQLAVDLRAACACRAAVPRLGGGRIVSLRLGRRGSSASCTTFVPYTMAKSGVVALTGALALELASDQILVNAIAPGPILLRRNDRRRTPPSRATPLGRWGGSDGSQGSPLLIDTDFVTGNDSRGRGRHLNERRRLARTRRWAPCEAQRREAKA
jgi:NAD(P)-dependent dehydrogenase (short-subunit alcohol dehydrogenase family)